ncbi:putative transcriptional regulator, TetR family [Nocardia nova SH22a]|uniref:Putative transcriptional regulator, TetR family n=1 Tax=Nocardia nova SH22a TaxID=1415166 RepID=W5TG94_9NOCA|nr:TetR/AcrR family transcriptional regulator [Nocardia nova]AHH18350.1 putative transcriptional regulator, TetR family [Nocardia nova SH22a]
MGADSGAERRVYAGLTMQQRVERRRAALVDAAIVVVAEQGWRQLTVERICESAGLIRRYFYESFADLDALTVAVIDTLAEQLLTLVVRNDLTAPRAELIHTMVDEVVNYGVEHPNNVRVLFGEMAATDAAAQRRRAAIGRIVQVLASDGRTIHHVDDPTIDLTASLLVNGSIATLLDWLDGTIAMTQRQFIDDMAALWLRTTDNAIARFDEAS